MLATVAIPTYNRADVLAKALESLQSLRPPKDGDYEILVVDNNSADTTRDVIERFSELLAPRLRSVVEASQGLSHARNRALREARGDIVCFIDDDVVVDPGWLNAVVAAFAEHKAAVVGGRSYLIYPTPKPQWLPRYGEMLLSRLDHGDSVLVNPTKPLFGVNFSVSREVALKVGGFSTSLGRTGASLMSGEEVDFCQRIRAIGATIIYEPKAVVGHMIPPERLCKKWFLRRSYYGGVSAVRTMSLNRAPLRLASMLGFAFRCWGGLVKTAFRTDLSASAVFERKMFALLSLGQLVEATRHPFRGRGKGHPPMDAEAMMQGIAPPMMPEDTTSPEKDQVEG